MTITCVSKVGKLNYCIAHYVLDDGGQQNVHMMTSDGLTFTLNLPVARSPMTPRLKVDFTYALPSGEQKDTSAMTY